MSKFKKAKLHDIDPKYAVEIIENRKKKCYTYYIYTYRNQYLNIRKCTHTVKIFYTITSTCTRKADKLYSQMRLKLGHTY